MKEKLKKIFIIKTSYLILEFILLVVSLFYLIKYNAFGTIISYPLYVLTTYSLICLCINIPLKYKSIKKKILNSNKYIKLYSENKKIRYKLSLYSSTIINLIYAVFKLVSGIMYNSVWFIAFALYYMLLVVMRVNIVKEELKNKNDLKQEWNKYKNTAYILLLMNLILTIIVTVVFRKNINIIYSTPIAIGIAAYTFYILTLSVINIFQYRKLNSPLVSASKVINLVTSLISMLSLEIVLLSTFGTKDSLLFREMMIASTGGLIVVILVSISIYMITKYKKNNM